MLNIDLSKNYYTILLEEWEGKEMYFRVWEWSARAEPLLSIVSSKYIIFKINKNQYIGI